MISAEMCARELGGRARDEFSPRQPRGDEIGVVVAMQSKTAIELHRQMSAR
jgi:hypothetical protein